MPPKTKGQKTKSEFYYKPKKRKVISPIQISEQSSETKVSSNQSSIQKGKQSSDSVSPDFDQKTSNKRFQKAASTYFDFSPYFTSNIETLAAMNMNFPQIPFGAGSQFMQSPPFNPQLSASGPVSSSPPQWATQIIQDIQSIKASVSKIDNIEKLVHNISKKVDDLETKMKTLDVRVGDCEKSSSFIDSQFEEQKKKLKSADEDLKKFNNRCKDFENVVKEPETKNRMLEEKTNDLEFRSLRENLLFHGIEEVHNEDCEHLMKQFIKDKLSIEQEIKIDRAHRLGKPKGRIRPIVVKFHSYTDRELIRNTANDKAEYLKGLNQGVVVQQTKAVLQKRRNMSAIYDREKAAGRTLKWAGAKLLVRDGDIGNFREVTE